MSKETITKLIESSDETVVNIVRALRHARSEFARDVESTIGKDEEYREAVDEQLENLAAAERTALHALTTLEKNLRENLQLVDALPYKPADAEVERDARDRLSHHMELANNLPLDLLLAELDGALLNDSPVELTAWSLVRSTLEARLRNLTSPADQRLATKIRLRVSEMQRNTGDKRINQLHEATQQKLALVRQQISTLTLKRAAHDPTPGFGSPLLTWQFGQDARKKAAERRYDPDALANRLGVDALGHESYVLRNSTKRFLT